MVWGLVIRLRVWVLEFWDWGLEIWDLAKGLGLWVLGFG